MLGGIPLTPA